MKVSSKLVQTEPVFKPVELTIQFDTQEALDAFYCIFNLSKIAHFFNDKTGATILNGNAKLIRDNIDKYVKTTNINNFHAELCKIIK